MSPELIRWSARSPARAASADGDVGVEDLPAELAAQLPELPRDGFELFVVTATGEYDGQTWRAGEVLLCRGGARPGETVVLVARGVGRPRLGTPHGTRFTGDAGEPCHPARWRSAGKVVARYTLARDGWLLEVGARVSAARPAPAQRAGGEGATARRRARGKGAAPQPAAGGGGELPPAAQLSLFAA